MTTQQPSVGRVVHYVSYGTPGGEYKSECRAAIVAAVPHVFPDHGTVDLVVLNPSGLFFNRADYHDGDLANDRADGEVSTQEYPGGSWHWPERV